MKPVSCDTFVVLPPLTVGGRVIFGKNSDRPNGEVQELVYQPAQQYPAGDQLQVNTDSCIP
jgi:secernin